MVRNYEKIICACGFLFLFANVGLPSTAFSVYQPYLVDIPGVGDGGASLIISVRMAVSLLAMFVVDRYYRRLDCRAGIALASAMTGVGFGIYALTSVFAPGLPGFFAGAVFAGMGYGFGGMVGITLLAGRWYRTRVGTALGIATLGSGISSIVLPPLVLVLIEGVSLGCAFAMEAAIAFAITGVVWAFVRNRPADLGLLPHGAASNESMDEGPKAKAPNLPEESRPMSIRRRRLVMLVAMFLVGAVSIGAVAYFSILMTSCGFDRGFAALALSVSGISLTAAKLGLGELIDRLGIAWGTAIGFGALVAGLALCCLAPLQNQIVQIAAAVLFGAGISIGSVGVSVWSIALSDESSRAKTVRDFQVCYAAGGLLCDIFPGFIAEATGTYVTAYAILLVTTAAAAIAITGIFVRRKRIAERYGDL